MEATMTNAGDWPLGNITVYPDHFVYPYQTWTAPAVPVDCQGDIHVFPCPHCDKCKCGRAVKVSEKK